MFNPPTYNVRLTEPAPYSYNTREMYVYAASGYDQPNVVLSYDDYNTGIRIYLSPEDARTLALKFLGAAMDAEQITEERAAVEAATT